jgi:D-alanyl-D-alanine dipeptidase
MRRLLAIALATTIVPLRPACATDLPRGFVYLRHIAPDIVQDMRYAGADNFTTRQVPGYDAAECILHLPVAEALKRIQAELGRQSLGLKVYDCYRPARASMAFVRWMAERGASTARHHPRVARTSLRERGYISASSAHSRGLAVDATLVRIPPQAQAPFDPSATYGACTARPDQRSPDNSLDMGTGFDCFDAQAHSDARHLSTEQRWARALLRAVMTKHGFQAYGREWWHFTFSRGNVRAPALDFVISPSNSTP